MGGMYNGCAETEQSAVVTSGILIFDFYLLRQVYGIQYTVVGSVVRSSYIKRR